MFWDNSFDGFKFFYDHLNSNEDIAKVKSIVSQQLIANLRAYLMQNTMMVCALFEVGDNSDQAKHRFPQEVVKLKEILKAQTEKFNEVNRQLAQLFEERKSSKVFLANISQEVEKLKKSREEFKMLKKDNEELKVLLKEAQLEVLSAGDEAFDKAKARALILQPDMNIDTMYLFKVIHDSQMVDPKFDIFEVEGVS